MCTCTHTCIHVLHTHALHTHALYTHTCTHTYTTYTYMCTHTQHIHVYTHLHIHLHTTHVQYHTKYNVHPHASHYTIPYLTSTTGHTHMTQEPSNKTHHRTRRQRLQSGCSPSLHTRHGDRGSRWVRCPGRWPRPGRWAGYCCPSPFGHAQEPPMLHKTLFEKELREGRKQTPSIEAMLVHHYWGKEENKHLA